MRGWSSYGCGLMQLGLRRGEEGILETTRWITLFFVPLVPLSRWRGRCLGTASQFGPDHDESFLFEPVDRLPLDPRGLVRTALSGWCLFAIAVGPAVGCILWVPQPPNNAQLALVLGSCVWPLLVTIWVKRRWRAVLQLPPEAWPNI
jgi:hypothetical protein